MTELATVIVVEDDTAVRVSLVEVMRHAGFQARAYASAEAFLISDAASSASCLLLDLSLPDFSGLDLQQHLRTAGHEMPIIFLSGETTVALAVQAVKSGAYDVIEPPYQAEAVIAKVTAAIAFHAMERSRRQEALVLRERIDKLTAREREVLDLIMDGMSTKEIARRLLISPRTVEVHRSRIMRKTEMRTVRDMLQVMLVLRRDTMTPPGASKQLAGGPVE